MTRTIRQETESERKAAILLKLGSRPDVRCWNNPTGVARAISDPTAVVTYGKKGSGDILGLMGPWGLFFSIEVKTDEGKQRPDQEKFERAVNHQNGIYILARTDEEAERLLLEARARWAVRMGLGHLLCENLELVHEYRF